MSELADAVAVSASGLAQIFFGCRVRATLFSTELRDGSVILDIVVYFLLTCPVGAWLGVSVRVLTRS